MAVKYCLPVIPSTDLRKSLRFWVEGLGFTVSREMEQDGKLVGCMLDNSSLYFWLNQRDGGMIPPGYEGIRLYWTPDDIVATRAHLKQLGYAVSEIEARDYGQTEFVLTDDDGYSHCFGIATDQQKTKG
jgi:catechol 2,3-dioxygenase-like lactoylglutathione lyase family enzyme